MGLTDFAYAPAGDAAGQSISVTILSDRAHVREEWCEDADMAGLRLAHFGGFDGFAAGAVSVLGDVALVDPRKCREHGSAGGRTIRQHDVPKDPYRAFRETFEPPEMREPQAGHVRVFAPFLAHVGAI